MQTNESVSNVPHERALRDQLRLSQSRKETRSIVASLIGLLLLIAVMLLMGCGHNPPLPCEPLTVTLPPATVSQPPTVSYSLKAQGLFKRWGEMLTNASATSN